VNAPLFVVVGRVNKGKSSIVATLSEDESVPIDPEPGTTRESRTYTVRVDGRPLFGLVDTPGFQDAPAALEEMRRDEFSAADRRRAVEAFVARHEKDGGFPEECRLLRPVLDGGRILYVVDGGVPYARNYEAEMEILRWTGRPRMALVNRIGPRDHADAWKSALGQYFSLVRDFDANRAGFEERMRLLESFRELDEEARPQLDAAVRALRDERARRRREAARAIADLLARALTHRVELELAPHEGMDDRRPQAEERLRDEVRSIEKDAHRRILELYGHRRLRVDASDLDVAALRQDLFAEATWRMFGLTHVQALLAGAAGGATLGALLDLKLGGATFMAGLVLGSLLGAGTAAWGSAKKLGSSGNALKALGGRRVARYGPIRHVLFASVLLDRALLHYRLAAHRAHSVRADARPEQDEAAVSIVRTLSTRERSRLQRLTGRLSRRPDDVSDAHVRDLREWIESLLGEL